jgi:hypothetical protein
MAQAVEQLNDKQKALHPSLSTIKKKKKKNLWHIGPEYLKMWLF